MRFRILGQVGIFDGDNWRGIGRRSERCILALLLLEVGHPVPMGQLVDALWDDAPPDSARRTIQVYVSRLRGQLDAAGAGAHGMRLASEAAGYAIHCDPEVVDAHRFTRLVEQARQSRDPARQATLLRDALSLWRGPALADVMSEQVRHRLSAPLKEARLAALELRVDADLALGRHTELAPELADLTARHPTSERLIAARMLALYRSARPRDALAVYERAASALAEQFGLDPGPLLRDMHSAVLREAPHLVAPTPEAAVANPPALPAQAPADIATFTGRAAQARDNDYRALALSAVAAQEQTAAELAALRARVDALDEILRQVD